MTDREQTRRDADAIAALDPSTRPVIDALLAELEQAERDRDNGIAAFNDVAATADRLERERDEARSILRRLTVGYEERDRIDPESWGMAIRDARRAVARGNATEERTG